MIFGLQRPIVTKIDMNTQVAILHDRVDEQTSSPDQKDALAQAEAVAGALRELGYAPYDLTLSMDLGDLFRPLRAHPPLFVFNLVESLEGQGRLIHVAPSLMDVLQIPYTGSGADAIYTTSNKWLAKRLLLGAGLPTPESFSGEERGDSGSRVRGTFIIKSVWEHASIGIEENSVVTVENGPRLLKEMEHRRKALCGQCFAEAYIEGREFNLSLLAGAGGPEVLPPAEIRFDTYPPGKRRMVGYRAKWDETSFEYLHTPRTFQFCSEDSPLLENLKGMAVQCWRLFNLRGYARVDFRVDEENRPWILEVNTNPCLSPDAGFAAATNEAGLPYSRVIERIIRDMERGVMK